MGHPLADLITYFVAYKFFSRGKKAPTCCGTWRQSPLRAVPFTGKSDLKIDLKSSLST